MEPRLLLVIDSLIAGGAQRQLVRLYLEFRERGLDVGLLYYHPIHHLLEDIPERLRGSVGCLGYQRERDSLATLALRLRKAIRSASPSTVISFTHGPSMLVAMSRMSGLRFHWLASERSGRLPDGSRLRRSVWKRVLRQADAVVPNSHTMAGILRGVGVPNDRIFIIPNGLSPEASALACSPERPTHPPRLLIVGNRVPPKNHPALYEALGRVTDLPWVADHLGRTGEHPNLDQACQDALVRHELSGRLSEHGRQAPGDWYAQANLLLLPSLSEGFPNVVLEAWAHGCPVLVSDRGDLPRIVEDGRNGLVARLDEPAGLERALRRALSQPGDLPAMGAAGREVLLKRYTMDAVASRWLQLVQ